MLTTANNLALRALFLIGIRIHCTKPGYEYYFGTTCLKPGSHRGINQKAKALRARFGHGPHIGPTND
ncbi:4410_t:CDS:1, partial [Paraglomus occultum]